MANKIGITKANVDKIVSELQEEKKNIGTYITKLDTELTDINSAWEGADATKYTKKMQEDYKKVLQDLNDSFQTYIDYLSEVFDAYKKLDDKFKNDKIEV